MIHQIQDDIIRRALDFFGLRGVVQHDYESTVLPVVVVGNLSQPTLVDEAANIPIGNNIFTVPPGETWRIITMSGKTNQTIGATALRQYLTWVDVNTGRAFHCPVYIRTDLRSETLTFSNALNTPEDWCFWPKGEFIVSEGFAFRQVFVAGDGTRTMANCWIMYQKLGERLVSMV